MLRTVRPALADAVVLLLFALLLWCGTWFTFQDSFSRTFSADTLNNGIQRQGVYAVEQVPSTGTYYRWTEGTAVFSLPHPGTNGVITIDLAGGPDRSVELTVQVEQRSYRFLVTPQLRSYQLPLPQSNSDQFTITLSASTFNDRASNRVLGVVVGDIQVNGDNSFPWQLFLVQLVATFTLFLLARMSGMPRAMTIILLVFLQGAAIYWQAHSGSFSALFVPVQITVGLICVGALLGVQLTRTRATTQTLPAIVPSLPAIYGHSRIDVFALGGLALVTLLYFAPYVLTGKTLVPYDLLTILPPWRTPDAYVQNAMLSDVVRQYVPWRHLYASALRNGELPFWNPYTFSGMPFLANQQSAVFYPLNLLFLLPSLDVAFLLFLALHMAMSGWGMYALLRYLRRVPLASFCGALVWMLCGFITVWRPWLSIAATLCWLPWLAVAVLWACDQPGRRAFGTVALVAALLLLAGHIQFGYYSMLLVGCLILWRVLTLTLGWQERLTRLAWVGGGLTLGATMCAVQLVATFELSRFGTRGTLPIKELMGAAIPTPHALTLLLPTLYGTVRDYYGAGNFVEFTGYIGIASLVLGIAGFFHSGLRRNSGFWFFAATAFIGLHLAYGGVLNLLLSYLPIYTSFHGLQRLNAIWSFGVAGMVAWGVEALQAEKQRRVALGALAGMCIALGLAVVARDHIGLSRIVTALYPTTVMQQQNTMLGFAGLVIGCGLALAIALRPFALPRAVARFGLALLPLLIAADLLAFARSYYPIVNMQLAYPVTPGITYLQANHSAGRMLRLGPGMLESPLLSNSTVFFGIEEIDGYDSLTLDRYNKLVGVAESARYRNAARFNVLGNFDTLAALRSPVLDLLGAAFAISDQPRPEQTLPTGWQQTYTGPDMTIYRNEEALPFAFVVGPTRVLSDDAQLARLATPDFDPRREALLEAAPTPLLDSNARGTATVTQRTLNTLALNVDVNAVTDTSAMLIVCQNDYPGWQAWINGTPAPILRTNFNLQGIVVPSGTHVVELRFTPTGFWPLLWIMVLGLVSALACVLWPISLSSLRRV